MLHIGALIDRAPGHKYVAALGFAELALRQPLPRANTLASIRKALPSDFVLALRAPRSAVISARGPLREDAELSAAVTWTHEAATALQARAVVIHTPSELTPGARSKELLRAYAAKLPRVPERHYVWAAQGAWEPEEMQALCAELGLVRAFDPLETKSSPGEVVYATLRALGHRAGFSYSALADAVTRTMEHGPSEAFISVDADKSFDVAKRLKVVVSEAIAEAAGEEEDAKGDDEDVGSVDDEDGDDAEHEEEEEEEEEDEDERRDNDRD
jgi:uncharacterized protein YecE (DUF72 family)